MFTIGEKVQVLGTVKDVVEHSVLIECDNSREYWVLENNVTAVPPATAEATPTAPPTHVTAEDTVESPAKVASKSHR